MNKKLTKLLTELDSLISQRITIEYATQTRKEYDGNCETSDIALMEIMDEISRIIDPEHSHYRGKS